MIEAYQINTVPIGVLAQNASNASNSTVMAVYSVIASFTEGLEITIGW